MGKKKRFPYTVCKPCWELHYCPYGPLVEQFPLMCERFDAEFIDDVYREVIEWFQAPAEKDEQSILEAADRLFYALPENYELVRQYDWSELECNVFGHICPVFFCSEAVTETKMKRRVAHPASRYVPREVMVKAYKRDGGVCQVCRRNVLDNEVVFDHVIPVSKGGPTREANLRVLCADCNAKKGDSIAELLEPKEQ